MSRPFVDIDLLRENGIIFFPCDGKKPLVKEWQKLEAPVVDRKLKERSNYEIQCGEGSGITVIDVDIKKEGDKEMCGMEFWSILMEQFNEGEDYPTTPVVRTGRGGLHLYFKYTDRVKTGTKCISGIDNRGYKFKVGIDIRNDNGNVVSAGSVHPKTKTKYTYEIEIGEWDFMEMPDWLINCFTQDVVLNGRSISFQPKEKPLKTLPLEENAEYSPPTMKRDLFVRMLKGLDAERVNSYDSWRNVCFCVGSVDKLYGWDTTAELITLSQKSPKFTSDVEVIQKYESASGKIGMGSMWLWLKEDNPALYNTLREEYRKNQPEEVYYYSDYRKFINKNTKDGYINVFELNKYFKSAFVKIDNGGNTIWFSRNLNKYDTNITDWEAIGGMPFTANDSYEVYTEAKEEKADKEKRKKHSFKDLLRYATTYEDFPIYSHIDFIPYLRPPKDRDTLTFNLFTGFPYVNVLDEKRETNMKIIEPILKHIKNILTTGNKELYDYYISYLAHACQKPEEKPMSCIIFISDEGLGKDLINHDFLKLVFGAKHVHRLNNISDLTKNFNKKLQGKLITIVGELKTYKTEADLEKLKGLITDTTLNIEPKGVDTYEVRDSQRFIFHTNNSIPFKISPNDRRFVVHKIPDEFIQSRDYYNELVKVVYDPAVACEFFKYLCEYDISNFNPRNIPMTGAKKQIQKLTLNTSIRFIVEVIEGKQLIDGVKRSGKVYIHLSKLYKHFKCWLDENGESKNTTQKIFKQRLSEKSIEAKDMKIGGVKALGYSFDMEELKTKLIKLIDNNTEEVEEIEGSDDESDCE